MPIFIDDQANIRIHEIKSRTRKMIKKEGIKIVFIDYLQLISAAQGENRNLELGAMTRGLKILAKELKVPVVALSQLNRKLEDRNDKRPRLADLRESGNIEQDADIVMFVHRPGEYGEEAYPGQTELIIAKQRSGSVGIVPLIWQPQTTSFVSCQRQEEPNGINL